MGDVRMNLKEERYLIIGICLEVHHALGPGFPEIECKEVLEIEFRKAGISFE